MEPTYVDSPVDECKCCGTEICRNCGEPELSWEIAGVHNGEPHGTEVWCGNCNLHVKRIEETDGEWVDEHELRGECFVTHHDVMAELEAIEEVSG